MYTTDEKRIFSISESRAKLAWAMPNAEKGDEIEIQTEKNEKDDAGYFLKVSWINFVRKMCTRVHQAQQKKQASQSEKL